jgi:hypothetical protein
LKDALVRDGLTVKQHVTMAGDPIRQPAPVLYISGRLARSIRAAARRRRDADAEGHRLQVERRHREVGEGKPTPTIGTPAGGVSQADYVFAHVDDLEIRRNTQAAGARLPEANELQVVRRWSW